MRKMKRVGEMGRYLSFDDMVWPYPRSQSIDVLSDKLFHDDKCDISKSDRYFIAGILAAYQQLVLVHTQKRRNEVCQKLKTDLPYEIELYQEVK